MGDIAAVVEQDVAISAKVLQLVNSAFSGLSRNVSSVKHAVSYLDVNFRLPSRTCGLILAREAVPAYDRARFPWLHRCGIRTNVWLSLEFCCESFHRAGGN